MSEEQSAINYASHRWTGAPAGGHPADPPEWVAFCADCGIEDRGDLAEFPGLEYPDCAEMGDR